MAGELVDIADEVAAKISAGTFSQAVTATRPYIETTRLEDLANLRVEVIPQETTRTRSARRLWTRQCTVLVGFQQRLDASAKKTKADELMALADEVAEYLELAEYSGGSLMGIDELTTWHRERYDRQSVFTRAILLTFQMGAVNHA